MSKYIGLLSVTSFSSSWSIEMNKYDAYLELLVYLQSFNF